VSITRRPSVILAISMSLAMLLAATATSGVLARDGETFVADVNVYRASQIRAPVSWNAAVDQITVERGDQMAAADKLEHNMTYVQARLGQLGVCWSSFGEIIYWRSGGSDLDPQQAVNAWIKSPLHEAIMVGDYNVAAGSWSRASSGAIYAVMVFVKVCGGSAPPPDPGESVRISGADRYATAAALSSASFGSKVSVAYIATGADFPDALAAGPAAAHAGGPVLLVAKNELPAPTATELARLKPDRIVVLGGTGAVSNAVLNALKPYAGTGTVTRLAGGNRYETAAVISQAHFSPGPAAVYVATGANFPDALAGGAAAGMHDGPILLVQRDSLPGATAAELARLHPAKVVVLGSGSVISDAVVAQLASASGAPVIRLYGSDRYQTAVQVSRANHAAGGPSTVYVATGVNFPDGLSADPVAGSAPGPLLLVPGTSLPSSVAAELARLAPDRVVVIGGRAVISDAVIKAINAAVP
jgi:putative cell wall-binding protein/uncharacterized protein YkwD